MLPTLCNEKCLKMQRQSVGTCESERGTDRERERWSRARATSTLCYSALPAAIVAFLASASAFFALLPLHLPPCHCCKTLTSHRFTDRVSLSLRDSAPNSVKISKKYLKINQKTITHCIKCEREASNCRRPDRKLKTSQGK